MQRKSITRIAAALLIIGLAACTLPKNDTADFEQWASNVEVRRQVGEFEAYLAASSLQDVIPTQQLLRTATDWAKCNGPQFDVPPRDRWPEVTKVLAMVSVLKSRKILVDFEAVSNFRNPKLNACAGGATNSAHSVSFAIDLVSFHRRVDAALLCDFWRTDGKSWEMGLGKYPSGRIHLDTSGYRTWGSGMEGDVSCGQPAAP